jgi:hypothetical protein
MGYCDPTHTRSQPTREALCSAPRQIARGWAASRCRALAGLAPRSDISRHSTACSLHSIAEIICSLPPDLCTPVKVAMGLLLPNGQATIVLVREEDDHLGGDPNPHDVLSSSCHPSGPDAFVQAPLARRHAVMGSAPKLRFCARTRLGVATKTPAGAFWSQAASAC